MIGPVLDPGTTLLGALERDAQFYPDRDAIRFLEKGEEVTSSITYSALHRAVEEVAAGLVARELAGKPVVLALPPGIEFVVAVLACFRAGAFAVTIPFPFGTFAERIAAIVGNARPAAVLSECPLHEVPELSGLPRMSVDDLRQHRALPAEPSADCLALIQYSSGSTRAPCGIAITHANLAANLAMIEMIFGTKSDDVGVSWLPPSHDMGLIGAILEPVFVGGTAILMPPAAFFARPIRWLRAIDRYRATVQGGPNFAYELCTRRVGAEPAGELDLSCWRVAFCGAEPIRVKSLEAFARHLAASRFDRRAFLACYGLAETTLISSAGPLREVALAGDPFAFSRVSCGKPVPGCAIDVRAETGEIFVSGPHVSPGRWSGELGAVVPWEGTIEQDGRRFVPTGDTGAISDGELVVLDRIKDVIAIHGRKLHAVDVEHVVMDGAAGVIVAAAAFAVPSERGERLVTLCEVSARDIKHLDRAELKQSLCAVVGTALGVVPEIVLLRHGALPRTSSGKIKRHASRAEYLSNAQPCMQSA
jgi:acyl-CoA synthetase (AMP-forming)/AMP-acid ligase II